MKNLLYLVLGLGLSLSLFSCASADKMLENGNYDGLVNLAVNKLSGKKKKEVYVTALEQGFEKITRHDMARIESLRYSNRAEDWEAIIPIARDMQKRQDRIEPLLPLVSETGYHAKFSFVQTDKIIAEAKSTAVSLYENRLGDMVTAARNGHKKSAREAYNLIDHIRSINDRYYRTDLRDEMWSLGINKILIRVENNTNMFMPAGIEDELLSSNFYNENGSWDRFYTDISEDMQIDYQVVLKIQDIDVSRDEWQERIFPYTREIVDGWEYVLDQNGNVAKDSLGNDIKRDRYTRVNATVVETLQSKKALVRTRMDVINANNGARIFSQPLEVEDCFNHVARNIFGDERALEPNLRIRVLPVSYPSDATLIWDAFRGLKPKFFNEMRRVNYDARA